MLDELLFSTSVLKIWLNVLFWLLLRLLKTTWLLV